MIEIAVHESRKMARSEISEVNYFDRRGSYSQSRNVVQKGKFGEASNSWRGQGVSTSHGGTFKPNNQTVCYNCYNKGHLSYDCMLPKAKKPRSSAPTQRSYGNRKRAFEQRINQLTAAMEELKSSFNHEDQQCDKQSSGGSDDDEDDEQSANWVNNVLLDRE
ncbi:uncharacterized protein LOC134218377 isoform X2 [Armigeres subalbatus]|uniref:uncharacterized protein LOC134218377 isoform X2 n=2 Tax=Armigeres subalbatus TaxID=124917 RepID=UPI002ED0B4CC